MFTSIFSALLVVTKEEVVLMIVAVAVVVSVIAIEVVVAVIVVAIKYYLFGQLIFSLTGS